MLIDITEKIEELSYNSQRGQPLKGDLKRLRRLRIGDYRIIYFVDKEKQEILIEKMGVIF